MDRYKVLGQKTPTSGSAGVLSDTLYTNAISAAVSVGSTEVAPKATSITLQTLVTSIVVCSDGAHADGCDFSIGVTPLGGTSFYLFRDVPLARYETKILSMGLTLGTGDIVTVGTHATYTADFTAFGVEITTERGPDV